MGLSLEDINRGVADVGKIIGNSLEAWRAIEGQSGSTATPPIVAPTQPQTTSQPQGPTVSTTQLPAMAWLLLGIVVLVLLIRR